MENNEGNYGGDLAERLERIYEIVQENVSKHLDYRIKEYMEDDAKDYTEGKLVLVFMPQTERGK